MTKLFKYKYIFLVFILASIGVFPLLHSGLPPTHDGEYHVIRFYEFNKALNDGDIYPRWAKDLNNGYGVPIFNYVYPFTNYAAAIIHFFGFSFIDSFKIIMVLATLFGSFFFFLWAKQFWGETGGLVSAVSFSFAPYRFVDIYIRGSVGEVCILALFPALLWILNKLAKENNFNYAILAGILYAGVIFSHNILAVMFTLFVITYCIFLLLQSKNKQKLFLLLFSVGVIGISLSSIFWLPAIFEKKYVKGLEIYNIKENFVEMYQLLIPSWGSGFSSGALENKMSFQIGIVPILIVFLSIISYIIFKKRKDKNSSIVIFILVWFFLSVFFMLSISTPLWLKIPLFNYFQFPWRFLSIIIVCTSFLSGGIIYFFLSSKLKIITAIFIILLTIAVTINYTKPAYYMERPDVYYTTRSNFIDSTNSPGNLFNTIWMKNVPKIDKSIFFKNLNEIKVLEEKTSYKKYRVKTDKKVNMQADIAYFLGWTVFQDGKKIESSFSDTGLLQLSIDKGTHIIEIRFLDTIIRKFAGIWSFMTILVIIFLLARKHIFTLIHEYSTRYFSA